MSDFPNDFDAWLVTDNGQAALGVLLPGTNATSALKIAWMCGWHAGWQKGFDDGRQPFLGAAGLSMEKPQ